MIITVISNSICIIISSTALMVDIMYMDGRISTPVFASGTVYHYIYVLDIDSGWGFTLTNFLISIMLDYHCQTQH